MAVKASAHVTLHSVVDIEATYRYYLLQSSTLSKPSKPTTNPPSSSWTDAEPTYTNGSTNSLYYTDLTVFSNGTFSYGEVSLSTAYEAAKEAYNKAVAAQGSADKAQDDIDNLEIGGGNLLRCTDVVKYSSRWTKYGSTSTLDTTIAGYLKVKPTSSGASFGAYPPKYTNLTKGTEYTLSFEAYADAAITLNYCYIIGTSTSNIGLGATFQITTASKKYTYTFTATADCSECSIMLGGVATSALTPLYIRKMKLERGNRATDWSPAPGDLEEEVDDLHNTTDSNSGRLDDAESKLIQLRDSISTLVRGSNGESLMTQTEDGWVFSLASFIDQLDTASSDILGLSSDMTDANSRISSLDEIVTDIGNRTEYIRLGTENGKPCIVLGEHDSSFKVIITNTDIRFMDGTSVPASISNQTLNIEKAEVSEELKQGGFVWKARSNGNYGLLWRGE